MVGGVWWERAGGICVHVSFSSRRGPQICLHRDPFAVEWEDLEQDPNEERYGVIGMVEGRLLFVGYTMQGEKIRIITTRKTEPYERRRYHEENREV